MDNNVFIFIYYMNLLFKLIYFNMRSHHLPNPKIQVYQ